MRTRLCDLLGIDLPIVMAPFGPWDGLDLAVAVCEAGGLGAMGTALLREPDLRDRCAELRRRTERPFAINHTGRPFVPEVFQAALDIRPRALWFHMGIPADLVKQAHDRDILWIQTVGDVPSAQQAVRAGADVLVAQGWEAGGNAGWVSTMVLVPAVVDVAGDVPVVAAGGIADGRGIAAALALGAQGACLGTRFLATREMHVDYRWKQQLLDAHATDAVKVANSDRVMPPFTMPQPGLPFAPRALRTPLVDRLERDPDSIGPAEVHQLLEKVRAGRGEDALPFTGQSAELVHDVVPAGELIERLVAQAETAARRTTGLVASD